MIITAMSAVVKKGVETTTDAPVHRIRITLTSRKVKALEKGILLLIWQQPLSTNTAQHNTAQTTTNQRPNPLISRQHLMPYLQQYLGHSWAGE
jgi:hypothetical protein